MHKKILIRGKTEAPSALKNQRTDKLKPGAESIKSKPSFYYQYFSNPAAVKSFISN